jgi:hypothetical protein
MRTYYTECENDWLRAVISGEIRFRKCPTCDNDGVEHQAYDENGNPCSADDETAERHTCEKCKGVAYIELPNKTK